MAQASGSGRTFTLLLIGVFFILLIAYIVFMFFAYRDRFGPFKTYVPPPAPANAFYPLGEIRPATEAELAQRATLAQNLGITN